MSAWLIIWSISPATMVLADSGRCATPEFDDTAFVHHVHDGDTVQLKDGRKLRLLGIDTPELARQKQPAQAFASDARNYLRQLVKQHDGRIGLVYDRQRTDRYGRTLAHLYFENGDSVQANLLETGLAVAYTTPPNDSQHSCYQQAETRARQQAKNLWALEKYHVHPVTGLKADSDGFHILRARVLSSRTSDKGVWLSLEAGLSIQIKSADVPGFEPALIKSLPGKTIEVRGWLHPRNTPGKKGFYLQLRHPDNMRIL